MTHKRMFAVLETCSKAVAASTIGLAHAGDPPAAARAVGYDVPADYSMLIWMPLLLLTFACTGGLLWLLRSDAKQERPAVSRFAMHRRLSWPAMRTAFGFFIAAASLVLLSRSSIAHADPLKACDLISQNAAVGIFGASIDPGTEIDLNGGLVCEFDGPAGQGSVIVSLLGPAAMHGLSAASMLQLTSRPESGRTIEPISGLGESANFRVEPNQSSLSILYHGRILSVTTNGSKNPDPKAAIIEAARQILGKI